MLPNFARRITLIVLLLTLPFSLSACGISKESITKTAFFLDTVITITIFDSQDTQLLKDCLTLCESYEKMFSRTIEGSDIWNINHANGTPVQVSPETAYLIKTALEYSVLTEGKIDITIFPVTALWDFTRKSAKAIPSDEAIHSALSHVNYEAIQLDGTIVTLTDPEAAIDLGFIAKGYIGDCMKEYLVSHGVKSAILNLGGNVLTIGTKPDGNSYRVGIQLPFAPTGDTITSVAVADMTVVSSGKYERYFEKDGHLYHHILNPQTGYPYENDLIGVTILGHNSMTADALSTTCLILGLTDGMALIESLEDTEALFITEDFVLYYSSGFPTE